jgi:hypothetical protein
MSMQTVKNNLGKTITSLERFVAVDVPLHEQNLLWVRDTCTWLSEQRKALIRCDDYQPLVDRQQELSYGLALAKQLLYFQPGIQEHQSKKVFTDIVNCYVDAGMYSVALHLLDKAHGMNVPAATIDALEGWIEGFLPLGGD